MTISKHACAGWRCTSKARRENLGMRAKIEILWRSYMAGWTLVGTVVGALITLLVTRFMG